MGSDPNCVVFTRPTPWADRIAFGICGAGVLVPLLYGWALNHFALPDFDRLTTTQIGWLSAWILGGVSLLAVAFWGGSLTVTIDRRARTLTEVAKVGPFTALDKTIAFKKLGRPILYGDEARDFIVEVPVTERVGVRIGDYASRAEAEAVLKSVVAALDVAEPLAEPVAPAALNPLKAGTILPQGPGSLGL